MRHNLPLYLGGIVSVVVLCAALSGAGPVPAPAPLQFPPEHGPVLIVPLRIVDGDTLEFAFLVQSPGRGRLWGIDAPERNTEAGKASARNLEAVLPLNQPTRCVLHGREKFGGFLVEVFDHHGQSVNQLQLDGKFAKPWHGKNCQFRSRRRKIRRSTVFRRGFRASG